MPLYTYENPETGEKKDIIQSMREEHVYFQDGVQWRRVFSVPNSAADTEINPFSPKEFVEKTGKKRGTMGDLFDQSAEASEKRKSAEGVDHIKDKYYSEYSKARGGKIHPDQRPKEHVIKIP